MNKKYGGAQLHLHYSEIKNDSYLGEFDVENKLKVHDIQKFTFSDSDNELFYLDPDERVKNKYDRIVPNEMKTIDLTTKELIAHINADTDHEIKSYIPYKKSKSIAIKNKLPTTKTIPKIKKRLVQPTEGYAPNTL